MSGSAPVDSVAASVNPFNTDDASILHLAAKAIEDTDYNKAANLYRKAISLGCPYSLYALGTMYGKYPPSTSMDAKKVPTDSEKQWIDRLHPGLQEIKKSAKYGYAPALYRMHWSNKRIGEDNRVVGDGFNRCMWLVSPESRCKAIQKSAYYLREAKACDPDGYALMFDTDRLKWELAFPEVIGNLEVSIIERYRLAIEIAQNLPNKDLVHERVTAYLDTLNIYLDNVARKGLLDSRPNELAERCRVYYMLGMACKDLDLLSEARKNFGLAAAVVLPASFGKPRPLPVEHQLAREELSRM